MGLLFLFFVGSAVLAMSILAFGLLRAIANDEPQYREALLKRGKLHADNEQRSVPSSTAEVPPFVSTKSEAASGSPMGDNSRYSEIDQNPPLAGVGRPEKLFVSLNWEKHKRQQAISEHIQTLATRSQKAPMFGPVNIIGHTLHHASLKTLGAHEPLGPYVTHMEPWTKHNFSGGGESYNLVSFSYGPLESSRIFDHWSLTDSSDDDHGNDTDFFVEKQVRK